MPYAQKEIGEIEKGDTILVELPQEATVVEVVANPNASATQGNNKITCVTQNGAHHVVYLAAEQTLWVQTEEEADADEGS